MNRAVSVTCGPTAMLDCCKYLHFIGEHKYRRRRDIIINILLKNINYILVILTIKVYEDNWVFISMEWQNLDDICSDRFGFALRKIVEV